MANQIVVITGASKGFGAELAKLFIQNGDVVYGIGKEPYQYQGLNYYQVDVANFPEYEQILEKINLEVDHIDILINNAGFGLGGPSEETPIQLVRKLFDVNFHSQVFTTNAFLSKLRASLNPKIAFISCISAEMPLPFQSFYSASKAALNAYAEALAMEVLPFRIQVGIYSPGNSRTSFSKGRIKNLESEEYQEKYVSAMVKAETDEMMGLSSISVAQTIFKSLNKKTIPAYKTIGSKAGLAMFCKRYSDRKTRRKIIYKKYGA